ncbi:TPA: hypothetical protein ACFU1W_000051 [Neisseria oralis]|jgi:hypothetical protein|nr:MULTISPECIES: hypothetical protein [Neisseria]
MKPLSLKELEKVAGGEAWIPAQLGFYPRRTYSIGRLKEHN